MPISIYGALRSDTTMTDNMVTYATVGSTFQISSYSSLTFDEGADPTVIAGDSASNENPNDPTQTLDGNAIAWDYTISVSDGSTTYEIGVVDYDLDGDGSFDWPTNEQGYFIAFIGDVPPLNTDLTIGGVTDNSASLDVDTIVPCFAEGTQIATPFGPVDVQDMRKGDFVYTLDNGVQTVRWIRSRHMGEADLRGKGGAHPVRIETGALGNGLPTRVLRVSPHHRMMLNSVIAERMFGDREVLVPAKKLVGLPGITIDTTVSEVTYYHILLDRHEILMADGAPSESLFLGPEGLKGFGMIGLLEIIALFPQISEPSFVPEPCRTLSDKGPKTKNLMMRHKKNSKPLISSAFFGLGAEWHDASVCNEATEQHDRVVAPS